MDVVSTCLSLACNTDMVKFNYTLNDVVIVCTVKSTISMTAAAAAKYYYWW